MARQVKFLGRTMTLPESRMMRLLIGSALVFGGMLGFLPILGFWMIPLGLVVLSIDVAIIRRWRRQGEVKYGRWRNGRNGNGNGNGRVQKPGPSVERGDPPAARG